MRGERRGVSPPVPRRTGGLRRSPIALRIRRYILIGGTTAYDRDVASLQAIMDCWSGTPDDYATRVSNLLAGNDVPLLDATTVTSNGGGNTMLGNGGFNLWYGNLALDSYPGYNPDSEVFISV
jgi:hypothetical protein